MGSKIKEVSEFLAKLMRREGNSVVMISEFPEVNMDGRLTSVNIHTSIPRRSAFRAINM